MYCISSRPFLLPLQGTDFTYENMTFQLLVFPGLLTRRRKLSSVTEDSEDKTSTVEMFCSLWLMFWLGPHFKDLRNKTSTLPLQDSRMKLIPIFWCNSQLGLDSVWNVSSADTIPDFSTDTKKNLKDIFFQENPFCSFNKWSRGSQMIISAFQYWQFLILSTTDTFRSI